MEKKIRIKALRQTMHLKQAVMADILGVTQSVVSRMELTPSWKVTEPQLRSLYERFGEDIVESFVDNSSSVVVSGNTNRGDGQQNIMQDPEAIAVIKHQSEIIAELARKQAEQSDRLLNILDRLTHEQEH